MLTAPVVHKLKKHYKYEPIWFHSLALKFHLLHKHLVLAIQEEKTKNERELLSLGVGIRREWEKGRNGSRVIVMKRQ